MYIEQDRSFYIPVCYIGHSNVQLPNQMHISRDLCLPETILRIEHKVAKKWNGDDTSPKTD